MSPGAGLGGGGGGLGEGVIPPGFAYDTQSEFSTTLAAPNRKR